ncbi:MAG: hypothetical protein ACE5Q6_09630 [Dehalococcoidia bacterium]
MMTTEENPSIHERVTQAVDRDKELLTELTRLSDAITEAKRSQRAVVDSSTLEEDEKKAASVRDAVLATAHRVFDRAMTAADKPYSLARQEFEKAEAAAKESLAQAEKTAQETYERSVHATTERHQLAEAEAQAIVHRLDSERRSVQGTISQHRNQILQALGINLGDID